MRFLLQKEYGGYESIMVRERSIVDRIPILQKSIEELTAEDVNNSLPVGSVEFVSRCIELAQIEKPLPESYPDCLSSYLGRNIRPVLFKDRNPEYFIKPVAVKKFTGGRASSIGEVVNEDEPCLECEWVSFQSEYRYYIQKGKIIGLGRYDEGEDNALVPDARLVSEMALKYFEESKCAAFALDAGVLENGKTVLVEINDGWATGFYKGSLNHKQYFDWLSARWNQLLESSQLSLKKGIKP